MRTRQDNLNLAGNFFDVQNQTANPLTRPMRLPHYLLAFRHKALRTMVKTDDKRAAFISYYRAAHNRPFSLDELGVDAVSLVGPYLLYHHLLCRLCGYPPEPSYVDLDTFFKCRNLAGRTVYVDNYFAFRLAKVLPSRRDHRLFQIRKYRFPLYILVSCDVVDDS